MIEDKKNGMQSAMSHSASMHMPIHDVAMLA